jgi:hypothetical protein
MQRATATAASTPRNHQSMKTKIGFLAWILLVANYRPAPNEISKLRAATRQWLKSWSNCFATSQAVHQSNLQPKSWTIHLNFKGKSHPNFCRAPQSHTDWCTSQWSLLEKGKLKGIISWQSYCVPTLGICHHRYYLTKHVLRYMPPQKVFL